MARYSRTYYSHGDKHTSKTTKGRSAGKRAARYPEKGHPSTRRTRKSSNPAW